MMWPRPRCVAIATRGTVYIYTYSGADIYFLPSCPMVDSFLNGDRGGMYVCIRPTVVLKKKKKPNMYRLLTPTPLIRHVVLPDRLVSNLQLLHYMVLLRGAVSELNM